MVHELKTLSQYFNNIWDGTKRFEVRKNDRGYSVGDTLILKEGDLGGHGMTDHDLTFVYSGRIVTASVIYILNGGEFGGAGRIRGDVAFIWR
jgi:hypothetical protein